MSTLTELSQPIDERVLRRVTAATAGLTGEDFFRSLVQSLSAALDVRYCFVSECFGSPPSRVATLAFWADGQQLDRMEWSLDGTPCRHVVGGQSCVWGRDIQRVFPDDRDLVDLEAESYAATPMRSSTGETIGHLAILDSRPFADRQFEMVLLELFAARAAAELDRTRALNQVAASQALLRQVIDLVPHFIFAKDRDGRFLLANQAVADAYGLDLPGELIGRSDADFNPSQEEVAGFVADDREVIDSGMPKTLRESITDASGTTRSLHTTKIPFTADNGNVPSVLGVSVDVTQLEQLQAQMLHVQKLESLGVLAGGIAHDFNNLLAGILGNAGLAALELGEHSPARPFLREVEKAAERSAELANQMLAYAGRGRLQTRLVDLSSLVDEMAGLLRTSISKKARLHLDLASDLPAVEADPTQLRQVVMNLLTNGSDALSAAPGNVRIVVESAEVAPGYFADAYVDDGLPGGDYVVLEVSDDGCGMTPSVRERLFDPFFTTKADGRGLGMAAVLGVVRAHQGAIKLDSEPGRGTTFRVYLPVASGEADAPTATDSAERPWQATGKALVADDEEVIRKLARSMLAQLGFEVVTAPDGLAAVSLFEEHADDIDFALLDVSMPGLDGEEVLERLRVRSPDLPVILSSGFGDIRDDNGEAEGVVFLRKPYRLRELRRTLSRLLAPS